MQVPRPSTNRSKRPFLSASGAVRPGCGSDPVRPGCVPCPCNSRLKPPLIRFLISAVLWLASPCLAQKTASPWRAYNVADGLPESACVSVTIGPQGKIVVRHPALPLVSELDGYGVTNIFPSPGPAARRIYESASGQFWTVGNETLEEFKNGSWLQHPFPELSASLHQAGRSSASIPICPVRQGLVLVLLPDKLVEFNSDEDAAGAKVVRRAGESRLESFYGMEPARDGGLWLSGTRGLAKIDGPLRNVGAETEWHEYLAPPELQLTN